MYGDKPGVITNEDYTFSIFYLIRHHHNFVRNNEVLQTQRFCVPLPRNLCELPDQSRYLYIGQLLQLSFRWRTHPGVPCI